MTTQPKTVTVPVEDTGTPAGVIPFDGGALEFEFDTVHDEVFVELTINPRLNVLRFKLTAESALRIVREFDNAYGRG